MKKIIKNLKTLRDEEARSLLSNMENIEDTILRASKIISNLRDYTNSNKSEDLEDFDVNEVINNTLIFCRSGFSSKNVKLDFDEIDGGLFTYGCKNNLGRALLNLLNNSLDAVEGHEDAWTKVEVRTTSDVIDIAVTDSGNGIPEAYKDKLMQPFFSTKSSGKGTGLGLAISRDIVEKFGGSLFLDGSSENTCFVIRISKKASKAA